jgi:MFS family permease
MAVDLNETTTNMQWVISAYMIAVGAAMIPGGRLGDLRGHRRIWAGGTADIVGATPGVLRLVSVLSMVGGAGLPAVSLIGRGSRRSSALTSPAS